jgi:porin
MKERSDLLVCFSPSYVSVIGRRTLNRSACRCRALTKGYNIFLMAVASLCASMAVACEGARADDRSTDTISVQAQPSLADALRTSAGAEDLRTQLKKWGVQFAFTYYGEAFGNPSGGVQQGVRYDARLAAIVDADLDKLFGWPGASFYATFHDLQGSSFSAKNVDSLTLVSNVEEPATARLYYLLIDQKLGTDATLRAGQFTAAREFLVSENAAVFVNSTFGWMLLFAQDLPDGGPAYPEATPGIRLKVTPSDQFTFMAALFNGDPANPGPGNAIKRDENGLAFRVDAPPLLIAELAYAYNQSGRSLPREFGPILDLPGTAKLGAWLYTGKVPGGGFNSGAEAGAPVGQRGQVEHTCDYALYGVIDQSIWRRDGEGSLNGFLRASMAPSDRNLIDFYFDAGLTLRGFAPSRPDDIAGIAIAYGRFSPAALAREEAEMPPGGVPASSHGYEATIELTYQIPLTQNWSVQPDLQYIIHPSGQLLSTSDSSSAFPVRNTTVIGIRTIVNF